MTNEEFRGRSFGIQHPILPPGLEKGYSESSSSPGQSQGQAGADPRLADVQQDYQQLKINAEQGR